MTMQKRLRGMVLGVAMSFAAYGAYAETVTVSTYYPSPFGAYQTLTSGVLDSTGQTHLATGGGGVRIGNTANVTGTNRLQVDGNTLLSGTATVTGNLNLTSGGNNGNLAIASCNGTVCYAQAVYA